jgi:hypothetical protein
LDSILLVQKRSFQSPYFNLFSSSSVIAARRREEEWFVSWCTNAAAAGTEWFVIPVLLLIGSLHSRGGVGHPNSGSKDTDHPLGAC